MSIQFRDDRLVDVERQIEPDQVGIFERPQYRQPQSKAVFDAVIQRPGGEPSSWLFALGPLTRPAWWEITAVPEINLQVERLVAQLCSPVTASKLTAADFMDMGGGI